MKFHKINIIKFRTRKRLILKKVRKGEHRTVILAIILLFMAFMFYAPSMNSCFYIWMMKHFCFFFFFFFIGNTTLDFLSPKAFHFRRAHVLYGYLCPPHARAPLWRDPRGSGFKRCDRKHGLFKNYVDFCCRVKTNRNRYPVMKFIWQSLPIFCLLTLKISCIQHEFVWSYASSKIPTIVVPSCPYCFSLSSHTSHVFPNQSLSGLRNRCWSCTLCLSVYFEHLTKTNYIYLHCRLHFEERHGPHPLN